MKLGHANERAAFGGRDPLIQRGAIIKSGRYTYRIISVRGSTVEAEIIVPWYQRALAKLRLPRPTRRPIASGDAFKVK